MIVFATVHVVIDSCNCEILLCIRLCDAKETNWHQKVPNMSQKSLLEKKSSQRTVAIFGCPR